MSVYNYSRFEQAREEAAFPAFRGPPHVGQRAASFPLEDLDTLERVDLRTLWSRGPAILEFGSFT